MGKTESANLPLFTLRCQNILAEKQKAFDDICYIYKQRATDHYNILTTLPHKQRKHWLTFAIFNVSICLH